MNSQLGLMLVGEPQDAAAVLLGQVSRADQKP